MSDSKTTSASPKVHVVRARDRKPAVPQAGGAPAASPEAATGAVTGGTAAGDSADSTATPAAGNAAPATDRPKEIGGPKGPEPTRFGDWERDGRCVDF